jgi:hypothetical protein
MIFGDCNKMKLRIGTTECPKNHYWSFQTVIDVVQLSPIFQGLYDFFKTLENSSLIFQNISCVEFHIKIQFESSVLVKFLFLKSLPTLYYTLKNPCPQSIFTFEDLHKDVVVEKPSFKNK